MDESQIYTGHPTPAAPPLPPTSTTRIEPENPWFAIWVQPRTTMRQIIDSDPRRLVHLLAILGGAAKGLQSYVPEPAASMLPLPAIITMKMILGALLGLTMLYLFGLLMWLTGRLLSGAGDFVAVRAALAWSNVPAIWGLLLLLPLLAFIGWEALNADVRDVADRPGAFVLMVPLLLVQFAIGVWQLVILFKCMAEAHRFSAWHALAAFIIAVIALAIPIVLLVIVAMIGLGVAFG